jgi:predicted membrane-bound mannosyltransferase
MYTGLFAFAAELLFGWLSLDSPFDAFVEWAMWRIFVPLMLICAVGLAVYFRCRRPRVF